MHKSCEGKVVKVVKLARCAKIKNILQEVYLFCVSPGPTVCLVHEKPGEDLEV